MHKGLYFLRNCPALRRFHELFLLFIFVCVRDRQKSTIKGLDSDTVVIPVCAATSFVDPHTDYAPQALGNHNQWAMAGNSNFLSGYDGHR